MKPCAVLLAGGLARRMGGGDKPLQLLGGRAILQHVIERIAPQVRAVVLNANGDPARFAAFGLPVISDTVPGSAGEGSAGPLAGVLAGLRWAQSQQVALLLSVPTDTPFLPADLAQCLVEAVDAAGAEIAVAASENRTHPVAALWPAELADELEAALARGVRKIEDFTAGYRVVEVAFPADPVDPFFNVNEPDDLVRAEGFLS